MARSISFFLQAKPHLRHMNVFQCQELQVWGALISFLIFFLFFFLFSLSSPQRVALLHQAISVIKMQTCMLIVLSQWVFFVLSQWVQGGVDKRKVRGKAIWLLCAAPYRVWLGHMGKSVGGLWGLKVWRCSSGLSFSWGSLPKAHSSRPLVSTAVLSPQP